MATWSGSAAPVPDGRGVLPRPASVRRRTRSDRLSDKEISVLRELARGSSTEEIAELLVVSPHTVRTHVKNGMRKLGARTRAHAVAMALSDGAFELEREEG